MNVKTKSVHLEVSSDPTRPVTISVIAGITCSIDVMTGSTVEEAKKFSAKPIGKNVFVYTDQSVYFSDKVTKMAEELMKQVQYETDSIE